MVPLGLGFGLRPLDGLRVDHLVLLVPDHVGGAQRVGVPRGDELGLGDVVVVEVVVGALALVGGLGRGTPDVACLHDVPRLEVLGFLGVGALDVLYLDAVTHEFGRFVGHVLHFGELVFGV